MHFAFIQWNVPQPLRNVAEERLMVENAVHSHVLSRKVTDYKTEVCKSMEG